MARQLAIVGEYVRLGKPVITVVSTATMKVSAIVKRDDYSHVKPGEKARLWLNAHPDDVVRTRVAKVEPHADALAEGLKITIEIDSAKAFGPDWRHWPKTGALATIEVPRAAGRMVLVPERALVAIDGKNYVWTVDEKDRARRKRVEVSARLPGSAAISKGLRNGEKVVVSGSDLLAEGTRVSVETGSGP